MVQQVSTWAPCISTERILVQIASTSVHQRFHIQSMSRYGGIWPMPLKYWVAGFWSGHQNLTIGAIPLEVPRELHHTCIWSGSYIGGNRIQETWFKSEKPFAMKGVCMQMLQAKPAAGTASAKATNTLKIVKFHGPIETSFPFTTVTTLS